MGGVIAPVEGLDVFLCEEPVFDEELEVDEVGVAGEGRETRVGAVAEAGRAEGQDLPVLLAGFFQKVRKSERLFAEGPDAVLRGQGRDGKQDTAATFHDTFSFGVCFGDVRRNSTKIPFIIHE